MQNFGLRIWEVYSSLIHLTINTQKTMAKRVRRFQTNGVWNVFENGEFIGQVIKQHNGWKPTTPNGFTYADLKTAVVML